MPVIRVDPRLTFTGTSQGTALSPVEHGASTPARVTATSPHQAPPSKLAAPNGEDGIAPAGPVRGAQPCRDLRMSWFNDPSEARGTASAGSHGERHSTPVWAGPHRRIPDASDAICCECWRPPRTARSSSCSLVVRQAPALIRPTRSAQPPPGMSCLRSQDRHRPHLSGFDCPGLLSGGPKPETPPGPCDRPRPPQCSTFRRLTTGATAPTCATLRTPRQCRHSYPPMCPVG